MLLMMQIRWCLVPGLAGWATGTLTFCSACVLLESQRYPSARRRKDYCRKNDRCLSTRNPFGV